MTNAQFDSTDSHPRRRVAVLDTEMSYVDTGRGDPIVCAAQAPYRGRTRSHHQGWHARILPDLAEPDRSHGQGLALPAGRLSRRDRQSIAGICEIGQTLASQKSPQSRSGKIAPGAV
jgi:hypothetical protein